MNAGDSLTGAGCVLATALVFSCTPPWEGPLPALTAQVLASPSETSLAQAAEPAVETIEAPPPPFSEGVYPCTDCHDPEIPVNVRRRPMRHAHQEIVLHHDEKNRWCLDCHSKEDRDRLHLAGGEMLDFEESYRLCGQCHGSRYRDWRAGIHGRRSGSWSGHKSYLLCVHCHDAHSPRFQPLEPLPAPRAPERSP